MNLQESSSERDACRAWYMDSRLSDLYKDLSPETMTKIIKILSDMNKDIRDLQVKAHEKIEKLIENDPNQG